MGAEANPPAGRTAAARALRAGGLALARLWRRARERAGRTWRGPAEGPPRRGRRIPWFPE
jgi:hypothetical protein